MKEQEATNQPGRLDLDAAREKLLSREGRDYWRGLEELAATPEFEKWIDDEFPERESIKGLDRRSLLKYMGASLMMASLAGCRSVFMEQDRLVPYVKDPEGMLPGKALEYATAHLHSGYARGTLVRSVMGRPIKVEGNPEHPETMGASDFFMQASLMDLYDPDRSQSVTFLSEIATWDQFLAAAKERLAVQKEQDGHGVWILTETVTSPTLIAQINAFLRQYRLARWVQYDPVNRDAAYAGVQGAFGVDGQPVYDFSKAEVVVSLDADFLREGPGALRYARDFASGRKVSNELAIHNRTYCLESTPTLVGANAEHVLRMKPSQVEQCARTLAARVGVQNVSEGGEVKGFDSKFVSALVEDLSAHRGRCLIVPGEFQSPNVHALCHAMNVALGNVGSTVRYIRPVEVAPGRRVADLGDLVAKMRGGEVQVLLILGGNPVFNAPGDFGFAQALEKVPFRVHLGKWVDETSKMCEWHLPESHELEAWGDARAHDGTVTLMQPLIAPLYQTWSALELMAALAQPPKSGYDLVREYWKSTRPGLGSKQFEAWWQESLHRGVVAGTEFESIAPSLNLNLFEPLPPGDIEVVLRPDPTIYDGRFANNGWLQECPKPLTTLTWDNTAQMSPATAQKLGVTSEEVVSVEVGGKKVKLPVWVMPGHPDDVVTVHFGYGRTSAGRIGTNVGSNAFPLMLAASPYAAPGKVEEAAGTYPLAAVQLHHYMEGRDIVREGTLARFLADPENRKFDPEPHRGARDKISMYPEQPLGKEFDGPQWGMTIDLDLCVGCNACVVACQAENNVPVVGKTEVKRGREMHWIRIDRYYRVKGLREGADTQTKLDNLDGFKDAGKELQQDILDPNRVRTAFQPVNCMHCETAPCEPVCPVAATVHSHEGLNQMVYNRCVGTRYCSNNCPYKVRRFNFLNYADRTDYPSFGPNRRPAPSLRLLNNPNVTVRGRGVMEKCTYCVQRINEARIEAKKENRPIRDGEIVTACQQACPTRAIEFGNIKDSASRIVRAKANPRNYKLLEEINTKPRTTYLARLSNPNPEIEIS